MNFSGTRHFDGQVAQKALIEKGDKVLVVRDPRSPGELWELPGGRLNVGEDAKEGLAWELKEELGADCQIHEVLHIQQFFQKIAQRNALLIVYRVTLSDPDSNFTLQEGEVVDVRWVDADESSKLEFFSEYRSVLDNYFNNQSL